MRCFKNNDRVNFVDGNNMFVGFDNLRSCCESFGYVFSDNLPTEFKCENLGGANECETLDDLERWSFDTTKMPIDLPAADGHIGGGVAVKIIRDDGESKYLILYNFHNGYYSHGFEIKKGAMKIVDGSI